MKNLDTIDVGLDERHYGDDQYLEFIYLILNGEAVKGTFDAYEFGISGLLKSSKTRTIEILTCGCGVAGCAGIFEGTRVKRRRHTVEWRDIDCGLPKRFYNFDRAQYDSTVAKTLQLMRSIAEKREARGSSDDDFYEGILHFWTVKGFEDALQWSQRWWESMEN